MPATGAGMTSEGIAVVCGHKRLFNVHNQLMQVTKRNTVPILNWKSGNTFRLGRVRHGGSNSRSCDRRRGTEEGGIREGSTSRCSRQDQEDDQKMQSGHKS